jgi:N-acylneuraminate cytidylyltransferase
VSTVCIIPARGGSTRLPGKNWRSFHGNPIIAYSINTARRSGLFDRIIVSTDHETIASIAEHHGAEVLIRDPALARDEVGTQEVAHYVLAHQLGMVGQGLACVIYATAPLITADDLKAGYHQLLFGRANFVVASKESTLQDAGCIYWGQVSAFSAMAPLISIFTSLLPIPDNRVCDINTEADWIRAEQMYAALHKGE